MLKTIVVFTIVLSALTYESDGGILKLGSSDFEEARKEFPIMLVKFYAPWCAHCKTLAPIYLEAAEDLKQKGSVAQLAEVDCTQHTLFCKRFELTGYPYVSFFGYKDEPIKYEGPRKKDVIVNWVIKRTKISEEKNKKLEGAKANEDEL